MTYMSDDYSIAVCGPMQMVGRTFTQNDFYRLNHAMRARTVRYLRQRARTVWLQPRNNDKFLANEPADYHFWAMVPKGRPLPDCDNLARPAKHILDGAVDAGIIVDDSPTYVRHTILYAPITVDAEATYSIAYQAALVTNGTPYLNPFENFDYECI